MYIGGEVELTLPTANSWPKHTTQISAPHVFSKQAMSNLSPADQLLFEHFGQGQIAAAPYACIHHAFEAQAAANPQAIAAQHLGDSITYQALDRQANRLAALLVQNGVSVGDHVALFLQRSIPMLVGLLATLKVGAAYVPQHVGVAPEAQLLDIIRVASTKVILTLSSLRRLVPVPDGHICIAIDEVMLEPLNESHPTLFAPNGSPSREHSCFILFTSGTTGKPNGVQVTHGNVCNILLTEPGNLGMRPGWKVAQLMSIAFDMAAWEILGCLAHGATLVIRGKEFAPVAQRVDVVIATPSILSSLDADRCHNVKVVVVAGEPCPRALADQWAAFCTFYNACGPTETTIVNTMKRHYPAAKQLTIGKPTPNNTVYVLDQQKRPCAIGQVGEMWAGGECVSAGYLDNPRLNKERYAPDPFLGHGRMMFRTRDLGRWTADGELEHLGRTDDQVKIRGFRVELDSVSQVLESMPSCTHAVTLKLDDRNLVAFVRPQTVDAEMAKQAVAKVLSYYCVPIEVIALDTFPMTSRGKVDKKALLSSLNQQPSAPKQLLSVNECSAKYQDSKMRSQINQCAAEYKKAFCDRNNNWETLHPMNDKRGKCIADYYDDLRHNPHEPATQASYQQFSVEVRQQYEFAEYLLGINFEPWFSDTEPYNVSCNMFSDVCQHRHLYFLTTQSHFGKEHVLPNNPMLNQTGVVVNGYELLINDMFRAIHDLFGHVMKGYGFGPIGEEKAWYEHLKFFSPLARPALTTETRGQNAWVNYGPHLRNAQGRMPVKGDPDWLPLSQRPFADQKITLLPAEVSGVALKRQGDAILAQLLQDWTPNLEHYTLTI